MKGEGGRVVPFEARGPEWLVVRTKSHQERIALDHLWERNVEPYCPMFQEPSWHPRAPRGPVPLFAGYIFVHCRPPHQLNAVRYCPGVLGVVMFDNKAATVSQEVVDELRAREAGRGFIRAAETEKRIPFGRQVRIMAGPLRGLEGAFRGYLRSGQRAKVLMQFLHAWYQVDVEAEVLAMAR
jgi:hypothetical protein